MDIFSLLKILRSKSNVVSDENAARIYLNIISQAGHRLGSEYIDIRLLENTQ